MKHLLQTISKAIDKMSDPEKAVVMLRLGLVTTKPVRMQDIVKKMKIPESHIVKIENEAIHKIRLVVAPQLWPKNTPREREEKS